MTDVTRALDFGDRPVRRPDWVAHVLDESTGKPHAILLHLPRGERVALSPTATRVWQLIVASGPTGARLTEIVPLLASEYGADPTIIEHDVAALVAQLTTDGWAEPVTAADRQSGAATGAADA